MGISSSESSGGRKGPLKPFLLSPRSSRLAFSRNSWAALWTDCLSVDWYFLFLWTTRSKYLILVPSPLLISLILCFCSAKQACYYAIIVTNQMENFLEWSQSLTRCKIRQRMLNKPSCSLSIYGGRGTQWCFEKPPKKKVK